MIRKAFQHIAVGAYGVAAWTGIASVPAVRRGFIRIYRQYKRHIESGPVDELRRFVPAGSTVIDVGANVGFFTEKFADWVGSSGRVVAVEPDADNLAALADAVARMNAQSVVEMVAAAACDAPGHLRLKRNPFHPGDHRIAVDEGDVDVRAVTVDELAAESRSPVALIKIDVQGAELMVLRGALRTLRRHKPVVFVEVDDRALACYGHSSAELLALLEGEGYAPHRLAKDGSIRAIDRASLSADLEVHGYVDVLCLRSANPAASSL